MVAISSPRRKIVKHKYSFTVSLPQDFIKNNDLKPGQILKWDKHPNTNKLVLEVEKC